MTMSGYRDCACRDCFEIAIGEEGALCHECEEAGCEAHAGECSVEHDLEEETEGEDPHAVARYCGHLLTTEMPAYRR